MAWILLCKRCKFGEKIFHNFRDIEFFLRDYFFLARPVQIPFLYSCLVILLFSVSNIQKCHICKIYIFASLCLTVLLQISTNSSVVRTRPPALFYSSQVLLLFNTWWTDFTGSLSALGLTSKLPLRLTRLCLLATRRPTNLAYCDPVINFSVDCPLCKFHNWPAGQRAFIPCRQQRHSTIR